MIRRVLGLLTLTLAASACSGLINTGSSDQAEALQIAQLVCQPFNDDLGTNSEGASASGVDVHRVAEHANNSANSAGKAARLDETWEDLASGLSGMAVSMDRIKDLPTDPNDRTPGQTKVAVREITELDRNLRLVYAECRKTSE